MVIIIRKRHIALAALCCVVLAGIGLWQGRATSVFFPRGAVSTTVIVDAGHGGEDGGAVAKDGTVESRLNLEIAQKLNDLLLLTGQPVHMTRLSDCSLHSEEAATLHQKKVSDLEKRVSIVNGTANAILISIHQNSLPSSAKTHGAQVFWNTAEGSNQLALDVQTCLNLALNPGNEKVAKKIQSTIYLTKNVTAPAIIVECGFLSNSEETLRLQTPSHQRMLAVCIAAGFLSNAAGEEVP